MTNKLYIGGIAYAMTDATLKTAFEKAGNVLSAKVIMDRETGKSKGFGFVEMSSNQEAQDAITMFNGSELEGRIVKVNEAKPRVAQPVR
jgi:RNA recognition motif-containing protein